ncbi:MAG: serine/threonine-protein kinase [Pyrinomonadaceae bacterium]
MVDWKKVEDGIAAAESLAVADRLSFLESYCLGDAELRAEIDSLLMVADAAGSFLEHSYGAHAAALLDDHNSGRKFGNYEIVREMGHGGMGAVYLARRTDGEFDQQVALKIVRGSLADSRMVERFRQERQILASLNHPNIAKLLDGGVSVTGEPFLAMEYVEGETITDFVARTKPPISMILRLFVKVCSAVAYAHRNLVVHRDIKPGNILVTPDGEPKLLDFGLAKLSADEFAGNGEQTETIFRALTPAYASPEQFLSQPITTASDIYSLGVLLFELLTGRRPFNFERRSLDDIVTTIATAEPALPSTVADKSIASQLKGDLDTIVRMAIRKEPERRYSSVTEFADDIERHLNGIPVAARPHTTRYRAGKFVRRHRIAAASTVLIAITLLAGISVSLRQTQQARIEKVKAQAVSEFLQSMLSASSPTSSLKQKKNDLTVKDLLDDASERLSGEMLSEQPEVKATLQQIIGTSYLSIGQYDRAEQNLNSAYSSQIALYGDESDETLKTLVLLASLWTVRGDVARAREFYERRLSILRESYRNGRVTGDFLIQALNDYALVVRAQGDSREAERLLIESIEISRSTNGTAGGVLQGVLALTLADQGRFSEAEALVQKEVENIRRQNGNDSPELASVLTGLGSFQLEQGKYSEAASNLKAGEAIYRKLNAPTFLALGDNLRLQANNYLREGDLSSAEKRIDEALAIYEAGTTSRYVNYATAVMVKGSILAKTDRIPEGESLLRTALDLRNANLPATHYLTALTKEALGECLLAQNKVAEAEELLHDSFQNLRESQGLKNPRTSLAGVQLARSYRAAGKDDLAAEIEDQIR